MIAGHLAKKNGYWYMILQLRDDAGRPKQKWLATHLKVEGNKRRAEELLFTARRKYTDLTDMQKRNNGIFFSDYLTAWVKTSQGKVAVGTYEEYQKCIRNLPDQRLFLHSTGNCWSKRIQDGQGDQGT